MEMQTLQTRIFALKESAKHLSISKEEERNALLKSIAEGLQKDFGQIRSANEADIAKARAEGQKEALVKRLVFSEEKLEASLLGITDVIGLADPIGRVQERRLLDTDLLLEKIAVPIGVIGMIFEARPDALLQIVSLCLKSGNGIVLKGGREAFQTNTALIASIQNSCRSSNLGSDWFTLLESHGDVDHILKMEEDIDLLIPRGSNQFVQYVMRNTAIPVLGHADGICHLYIDEHADLEKALEIAFDSKTQYPAACNAIETLLVHASRAEAFLPRLERRFKTAGVTIHGDATVASLIDCVPYQEGDYGVEYLALELNIKVVGSLDEALEHIKQYGSHHTDAIVSEDKDAMRKFFALVDSADVFANCSTRFADGFRFGLGAEVGISTAKIHARGPVGLGGLMSTKYVLRGNGEVVSSYTGKNCKKFLHKELDVEGRSLLLGENA